MPIRKSFATEVAALIAQLDSPRDADREGAVARLRVIGTRAVPHLVDATKSPSARTRLGALHALEALPDRRSIPSLLDALGSPDAATASAAAAALRPFIATEDEPRVIDPLVAAVTDPRRDPRVRHAALRALAGLGAKMMQAVIEKVGEQGGLDPEMRRAAEAADAAARAGIAVEDPADARDVVTARGSAMPLGDLLDLVSALRARESREPDAVRRREWMTARALAHQRLAARKSRIALFDLRESLETADGPLPVEFLSAAAAIGDADCAAAVAMAYAKARKTAGRGDWWIDHLADTFRAIVKRERMTRRNPAMQRVARKWPEVMEALWRAPAAGGGRRRREQAESRREKKDRD